MSIVSTGIGIRLRDMADKSEAQNPKTETYINTSCSELHQNGENIYITLPTLVATCQCAIALIKPQLWPLD